MLYPAAFVALTEIDRLGCHYPAGLLDDFLERHPVLKAAYDADLIKEELGGAWGTLDALVLTDKGYRAIGVTPPVGVWARIGRLLSGK